MGVGTGGPLWKSYSGVVAGTEVHYIDAKILSIRWHSNSKDTSVGFVARVYGLVSTIQSLIKAMQIVHILSHSDLFILIFYFQY